MKLKKSSKTAAVSPKNVSLKKKVKKEGGLKKKTEKIEKLDAIPDEQIVKDVENEDEISEDEMVTGEEHLSNLKKIQEADPEFFKFLQEEDPDLLQYQESDIEEGDDEEEEEEEEEEKEEAEQPGRLKKPKAKKDSSSRLIFDGNMFSYLQSIFDPEDGAKKVTPNVQDVKLGLDAFLACISRVGADMDVPKYVVNEQSLFEATIRLVFQSIGDFFIKTLTQVAVKQEPTESSTLNEAPLPISTTATSYKKYKTCLKVYLEGLLMFLNEVQSDEVIISTLKAIHRALPLFSFYKRLSKSLIKAVVRIWSRKTIDCRVVAYICLSKLCKISPSEFAHIFKSCYLGFVSNAREVTFLTWPLLQFMHRTFSELTLLNPTAAYPYAFVYIRQTAIHLRNAIISKKRMDMMQTVYNWQLIQCLYLWVRVISKANEVNGAEAICELVYPLTQIIIGVSKLYVSSKYIPLRFHCVSMLIQLQANCTTYIPTFELSAEIMTLVEIILRKKPKTSKVKVQHKDLSCILRVTSQQLEDPIVRSDICQFHFRILLQSAHLLCNQPGFPDLAFPAMTQLKGFLKNIRCADTRRLYKGLFEKIDEHAKFVTEVIATKDVDLNDEMNVRALKLLLNTPEAPLRAYYRQWEKIWKAQLLATQEREEVAEKVKKVEKEKKEAYQEKKLKTKKRKVIIAPAATRADATIPDALETLGSWSDDDEE